MTKCVYLPGVCTGILCLIATGALGVDEKVTVVGKVTVTEDDDWNITAVKITTEDAKVYNVTLDAKGRALGGDMNGAKVQATGTLAEKNGQKWLTVLEYKEIEEEKREIEIE